MTLLSSKEKQLICRFLKEYADRLCHNTCNDWDFPSEWTREEIVAFVRDFHNWNGSPEDFDEDHLYLGDFSVVSFLAHKFNKEN